MQRPALLALLNRAVPGSRGELDYVSTLALKALVVLEEPGLEPLVVRWLDDPRWQRELATLVDALGTVGGGASVAPLCRLLQRVPPLRPELREKVQSAVQLALRATCGRSR
jgi:hypothetical protein